MKDLGTIRPGSTIYIEFDSFGADGESLTLTGLAAADIEVYKDGGTTQRASDSGYTLLDTDGIDFDGVTGIHGVSISLADNTTAGFWAAGSHYRVVISSVTINAQTVSFTAATFRIGYSDAILNTTIASLSSQTSFTLTSGPAEDDALNGSIVCIHDVASAVQLGYAVVSDYTGSTKTVTLSAGTTFTAAATDNISVFPPVNAAYGGGVAYSTTRGLAGTALPNAAAEAAGGLYTRGTGAGQIKQTNNGEVDSNATRVAGTAQTAGDIVSYLNGIVLYKGTIHSSGNDTTHIVFTSATLADDSIIDNMLVIEDTSGNVKECKWVIDWDLATATATLDSALSFTPEASNDRYWLMNIKRNVNVVDIDPTITTEIVDAVVARFSDDVGTAQAGGSTTITLRSGAVATNDYYNGAVVNIYGGTGEGQSRRITGYVGSTRVATVASAWVTNPDSSSTYFVIGRIA